MVAIVERPTESREALAVKYSILEMAQKTGHRITPRLSEIYKLSLQVLPKFTMQDLIAVAEKGEREGLWTAVEDRLQILDAGLELSMLVNG